MASPAEKRFQKEFGSADLEQTDRESVAALLGEALDGRKDFQRDLFVLLASDPRVPCAGWFDPEKGETVPCEHGRVIRLRFHDSSAPDGRSEAWRRRAPYGEIRCVSCGSMHFMPEYRKNVLARTEV